VTTAFGLPPFLETFGEVVFCALLLRLRVAIGGVTTPASLLVSWFTDSDDFLSFLIFFGLFAVLSHNEARRGDRRLFPRFFDGGGVLWDRNSLFPGDGDSVASVRCLGETRGDAFGEDPGEALGDMVLCILLFIKPNDANRLHMAASLWRCWVVGGKHLFKAEG